MFPWLPALLAAFALVVSGVAAILQGSGRRRSAAWWNLLTPTVVWWVALSMLARPDPGIQPVGLVLLGALAAWTLLQWMLAYRGWMRSWLFWGAWLLHLALAAGLVWLASGFRIF